MKTLKSIICDPDLWYAIGTVLAAILIGGMLGTLGHFTL